MERAQLPSASTSLFRQPGHTSPTDSAATDRAATAQSVDLKTIIAHMKAACRGDDNAAQPDFLQRLFRCETNCCARSYTYRSALRVIGCLVALLSDHFVAHGPQFSLSALHLLCPLIMRALLLHRFSTLRLNHMPLLPCSAFCHVATACAMVKAVLVIPGHRITIEYRFQITNTTIACKLSLQVPCDHDTLHVLFEKGTAVNITVQDCTQEV